MKISYNWLKQHIDINESPQEIADMLTRSGLEVEKTEVFESIKGGLKGLIIAEVITCEKHPGADKLKITTVNTGTSVLPVVCGAANVAAGQKVVLATVGATVYPSGKDPFTIGKAKIRGEVSEGMICAEDEIGLGAGWAEPEYRGYGFPFAAAGGRLDILEEAAACVRSLLREEVTSFEGRHFRFQDARLEPRPVQTELPIWIGGGGERRTLRIVAEHADGWNVPFISPEDLARKREVLTRHCADVGRDPGAIRCAVNVGIAPDEAALEAQFGAIAPLVRPGVLVGQGRELADRIGQYLEAGADQVNIALRAPWEPGLLDLAADAVATFR
jgi:tRNA-binding EMAP/Myf-like protein